MYIKEKLNEFEKYTGRFYLKFEDLECDEVEEYKLKAYRELESFKDLNIITEWEGDTSLEHGYTERVDFEIATNMSFDKLKDKLEELTDNIDYSYRMSVEEVED